MAKDDEDDRKIFAGVVLKCPTELKLVFIAFLVFFSILTLSQFFHFSLSYSFYDTRHCISTAAKSLAAVEKNAPPPSPPPPPPPPPPPSLRVVVQDEVLEGGKIIKRAFNPFGTAAYNFILMSAYRSGHNTFAVIGLASKPLHVFGKPSFQCEWVPHPNTTIPAHHHRQPITVTGQKYLPDWNMGRVYTVVVINCTFPVSVGNDSSGGKLLLHASTNGGGDSNFNLTDTIEALTEAPGSLNLSQFTGLPKYDFLYCGSCLYGNLSPQRLREWLAYHIKLFGPRSHFVVHDAGGVHSEAMEVLRPWIEKGYVTLEDIKEQERFDGYYHNQFLVLNDCLHRYRFMAKWMFFFDVDEYIFIPKNTTLVSVMDSLSNYTHFTFEQMPMSNKLCRSNEDTPESDSQWGFEKLIYKDVKQGVQRDRKYAVQPRYCLANGVHRSDNMEGMTTDETSGLIMYYHYHGTVSERNEPCQKLINTTETELDGIRYVLDTSMREAAESVKRFELETIGPVLQKTRQ